MHPIFHVVKMSTTTFTPYEYPAGYPESFKIPVEAQLEAHNQLQNDMIKTCYDLIVNATRNRRYRIFVDNGSCSGDLSKLNTEALKEMVPGLKFHYDKYWLKVLQQLGLRNNQNL